jgi:flagellar assembly protein FliH
MSSSDAPTKEGVKVTGRVFMGVGSGQSMQLTLDDLKGHESIGRWSKELEQEVMERVQVKAAAKARDIVAKGMAEARELRGKAREEGYAEGVAQAQQQLEQAHHEMADSLGQALDAIQQGSESIWKHHREELASLVRIAVEKILNIELASQRQEVLAGFLDQAVEALEEHAGLTLTVHPEDQEAMHQVLTLASQRYPRLSAWRVKTDPAMQPGGLLVESDHGMVDNTLEGRMAIVEPILRRLELPEASADEENGA